MSRRILVTGGLGYIGSHTCIQLMEAGYDVVCFDNLSNSKRSVLDRIALATKRKPKFCEGDIRNADDVKTALLSHSIDAVIHFAGLKAVGESVAAPLMYYDNNVTGTQVLLSALQETSIRQFVFSSSATVYGSPESVPIKETAALRPTNPYGRTKLMIEDMLRDLYFADSNWSISILRYFNPVGAHPSGELGEDPNGIPNNLMPFIAQVAVGRRDKLSVFGNDYETIDGTGVRDYVHVMDLADGHIAALRHGENEAGCYNFNLGTGTGYSVLEMVNAFQAASKQSIPYEITNRRAGDIAICFADCSRAKQMLGWQAHRTLSEMTRDTWRWQSKNPKGYPDG